MRFLNLLSVMSATLCPGELKAKARVKVGSFVTQNVSFSDRQQPKHRNTLSTSISSNWPVALARVKFTAGCNEGNLHLVFFLFFFFLLFSDQSSLFSLTSLRHVKLDTRLVLFPSSLERDDLLGNEISNNT